MLNGCVTDTISTKHIDDSVMGSSDKLFVAKKDQGRDGKGARGRGRATDTEGEVPTFKPISKIPSQSDGSAVWRKYYLIIEGQLRLWYKQKRSFDAPEQTIENWSRILPYIINLMMASTKLFHIDPGHYLKHELDVRLWKYGVYQFIVLLRSVPPESKLNALASQACKQVFEKGLKHFKELLIAVPVILKIDLKPIFSGSSFLSQGTNSSAESDLVYRLFVAVGDMHRYSFEMTKVPRDGKLAKDMYTAARYCDPLKSRAYNQLGVISKAQNDIVGTIYNYTRACAALNPADGCREQLLFVYDEIYKKFNLVRKDYWYTKSKAAEENLTRSRQGKFEIWLPLVSRKSYGDMTVPPAPEVPPSKLEYFKEIPQKEVLNQFSLVFAHFLGMLFTKIGTEALEEVSKEVTVCFAGLLTTANSLKFSFIMEVMGLLLFMTDYLTPPAGSSDQGAITQIKYMREEAVKLTYNLLMVVAERMLKIMELLDWNSYMLTICSAVLHVWCRWARRRPFICSELIQQRKLLRRSPRRNEIEKKETVCQFLMLMQKFHSFLSCLLKRQAYILFPTVSTGITKTCNQPLGLLSEQLVLEKFGDILYSPDFVTSNFFHDGRSAQEKAQLHLRLTRIQRFFSKIFSDNIDSTLVYGNEYQPGSIVDDLAGKEFNLLRFIHESIDKPLRSSKIESKNLAGNPRRADCNNARVIVRECVDTLENVPKRSEIGQLPITKTYELWSDLCVRGVRTEIVIKPIDVVLDTNCLIRRLDWIDCLLHILPRAMIIPSTVLLELRGLMKGARTGEAARPQQEKDLSPEKQQDRMIEIMEIGEQCIRALEYLNDHKSFFRVVTLCGREFKMYNYMKQKIFERRLDLKARNDEKILETCIQMEARNTELRSRDSPFRIHRNTILITGDRSLRVRAFAQDIPARDIQSFTKWLMLSNANTVKTSGPPISARNGSAGPSRKAILKT